MVRGEKWSLNKKKGRERWGRTKRVMTRSGKVGLITIRPSLSLQAQVTPAP